MNVASLRINSQLVLALVIYNQSMVIFLFLVLYLLSTCNCLSSLFSIIDENFKCPLSTWFNLASRFNRPDWKLFPPSPQPIFSTDAGQSEGVIKKKKKVPGCHGNSQEHLMSSSGTQGQNKHPSMNNHWPKHAKRIWIERLRQSVRSLVQWICLTDHYRAASVSCKPMEENSILNYTQSMNLLRAVRDERLKVWAHSFIRISPPIFFFTEFKMKILFKTTKLRSLKSED